MGKPVSQQRKDTCENQKMFGLDINDIPTEINETTQSIMNFTDIKCTVFGTLDMVYL